MKKTYIAPETELEVMATEDMIATSLAVSEETVSDEGFLLSRDFNFINDFE